MRDGLIQLRHYEGDQKKISVVRANGTVVRDVRLSFEPVFAFPLGPGRVLYSDSRTAFAVVADDSDQAIPVTAPKDSMIVNGQVVTASQAPRYVVLAAATGRAAVVLDIRTGKTQSVDDLTGENTLVFIAMTSPDSKHLLLTGVGATLLTPGQSDATHHFGKNTYGECFTRDGTAVLLDHSDQASYTLIAFDPAKNSSTAIDAAVGPGTLAACVGNDVVVSTDGHVSVAAVRGGKAQQLPDLPDDASKLFPTGDGRHALIAVGDGGAVRWSQLDVTTGKVQALPELDGRLAVGDQPGQQFFLFGVDAKAAATGDRQTVFGLDTATGKVTTIKLAAPALLAEGPSSSDGKMRVIPTSGVKAEFELVDLQRGTQTPSDSSLGLSPSGDRVLKVVGRGKLAVADASLKPLVTVDAGTGVWTAQR